MPSPFLAIEDIQGQVDFGIITVRIDEFQAALDRFTPAHHVSGPKRYYEYARVSTATGRDCGVAIVRTLEQGQGAAQAVARDLIDELDPRWLLLVGIAGGIPDQEFTLGDVLLASRLHDFSVRAALEGKPSEFNTTGGPMHPKVDRLLAHIPAFADRLSDWNSEESIGCPKPNVDVPRKLLSNSMYGNQDWRQRVLASLRRHFPENEATRPPLCHVAAAACGNTLVKDAELAKEWLKFARHIGNIEMELGGVYLAARHGGTQDYRVLAVRGISDIVGFHRGPDWTAYACHSAASFAHALIRSGIINTAKQPENPQPARRN